MKSSGQAAHAQYDRKTKASVRFSLHPHPDSRSECYVLAVWCMLGRWLPLSGCTVDPMKTHAHWKTTKKSIETREAR